MFPNVTKRTGLNSDAFCMRFLKEEQVAMIPGSAFGPGGEGFARCCYATSMKDLEEALRRLERCLKRLDQESRADQE